MLFCWHYSSCLLKYNFRDMFTPVIHLREPFSLSYVNNLGIYKWHCNVSCSIFNRKSFVQMCEPPRMHEAPAFSWGLNGAIIPQKFASTSLKILSYIIQSNVDGKGWGIVVGTERALSFRWVLYYKIQQCKSLCIIACEDLQCDWSNELSDEMKPNILQPDLLHMNIVSRDIFITTRYAAILETTLIY